jgi:hypothetical protein
MWRIITILFALLFFSSFAEAQQQFQAASQISVKSYISVNNTTSVAVKTTGGTVYQVDAYNNGATLAYVKLYNATSTTCGSGTPMARYLIPYGTSSSGGGFVTPNINGDAYALGIRMCITTGIADNDTTAPAADQFIVNVHYK